MNSSLAAFGAQVVVVSPFTVTNTVTLAISHLEFVFALGTVAALFLTAVRRDFGCIMSVSEISAVEGRLLPVARHYAPL
jgi:hypothetical protein